MKEKMSTRYMAAVAMFAALSFVSVLIAKVIPNVAGFLSYEPKDIFLTLAGFLYGPLAALACCIVTDPQEPKQPLSSVADVYAQIIADLETAELYLCPRRAISFDGFVCYEGRRFGVPYWYEEQVARVSREGWRLHVYSEDLSRELVTHEVTWSRADSWCEDQWEDVSQPEELPTQPVTTTLKQSEPPEANPAYSRFDFGRMV